MKKKRLIPVLLLKNGWLVQSKGFSKYQNLGNPITAVKRLSEWASDELIYLDISADDQYDLRRDDLGTPNRSTLLDILKDVSKVSFMPVTVGGKIRNLKDIEIRLATGADKVSINTAPLERKEFISEAAKEFGSQCIVVSIDAKKMPTGKYYVFKKNGKIDTGLVASEWAKTCQDFGAGEILINSIDRDGAKNGFEIPLISEVSNAVSIPVIGLGGAGEWSHFEDVLKNTKADAVAAANIFQYIDQSVYIAKKHLFDKGLEVRSPDLLMNLA